MEIKYGKQLGIEELQGKSVDLFIMAGNHEKRMFTALKKIQTLNSINKVAILCYPVTPRKKPNETTEYILINSHLDIFKILDDEFEKSKGTNNINIVVDYSCMTKSWYYSIILYISKKKLGFKKITSYFIYTPSKYSRPLPPKPNTDIAPLPGKYVVPTDKPKALIVCLGYEQNKAEGIIEHLDPKIAYLFYSKPALDSRFVNVLEKNNKDILSDNSKKVITFPFDDLLNLERKLTAIYESLKDKYSIIIAPLGPKPFTFISMLMSVKYNDIDIWRVGSGYNINEYKREPISDDLFIISEIVFESES